MKVVLSLNRYFVNVYVECPLINEREGESVCARCQSSSRVIDHTHYSKPRVKVCYDNAIVISMSITKHSNCTSIWVTNGMSSHFPHKY